MNLDPKRYDPALPPASMPPTLLVVIDTEEEFDWSAPFSRAARSTRNLRELWRAQEIFDRHGAVPLYVIDHPVAEDAGAMRYLCDTRDRGACEIGAHLHPWVTPPHEERVNPANSYLCNLPPALQYAKIATLTALITRNAGEQPRAFRTGRYGVGPETLEALIACGYDTDLSPAPHSSFTGQDGPSFYGLHNNPFWADDARTLLSLPVTTGFSGVLRRHGPALAPFLDDPRARRAHVPGLLARARLLERARLTPEGTELAELKRLLAALVHDGERILTLSFHSSTLLSGATAYARTDAERDAFLARLDATLAFFTGPLGGVLASCTSIDTAIRAARPSDRLPNLKPGAVASRAHSV